MVNLQIFDFLANEWTIIRDVNLNGGTIDVGALSTCDNTGGIYNGDVILSSQQEVDDFGANNYTHITGYLVIGSDDAGNYSITNLDALIIGFSKSCSSKQVGEISSNVVSCR